MSKAGVKNRAPAPIQITAEQLLREAQERGLEDVPQAPQQFITDREELVAYQQQKRKDFEDQLRRQRQHVGIWCRYALWEASQMEFERARSVFERSLDVDYRNPTLWLKYAEMEMKNKFINHARNIWDRAVTYLPRLDTFWYKYSYMEEMVGAIDNARQVFQRWMEWEPDDLAWGAFVKFEMRQGQVERARGLFEKYVQLLPTCRAYLKYARWEEGQKERAKARGVYERALVELHVEERSEKLIVAFARFEERCKEFERARVIYQYAVQFLSEAGQDVSELKKELVAFEKKHGGRGRGGVDKVVLQQKRESFEERISSDYFNYDLWFDYARLEETEGLGEGEAEGEEEGREQAMERVRRVYSRAVSYLPASKEKKHWKRYVYLFIYWAVFEELVGGSVEGARRVYAQCLDTLPHRLFTFGKVWLNAAQLEVRAGDLTAARKVLGRGIGMCGKGNIFRGYIELERQLGEIERCRQIYAKYLEAQPYNVQVWRDFADLEAKIGESKRARALFELGVGLGAEEGGLDFPEVLWKAFIDFEIGEGEVSNARGLYSRLLERANGHVRVWIAFARFEMEIGEVGQGEGEGEEEGKSAVERARDIYTKGYGELKLKGLKEERLLLLESWRDTESEALQKDIPGSSRDCLGEVEAKFPRKVRMRRAVDGEEEREEEYFDYLFPDDEKKMVGMKLLEKALAWKSMMGSNRGGEEVAEEERSVIGKRPAETDLHEIPINQQVLN